MAGHGDPAFGGPPESTAGYRRAPRGVLAARVREQTPPARLESVPSVRGPGGGGAVVLADALVRCPQRGRVRHRAVGTTFQLRALVARRDPAVGCFRRRGRRRRARRGAWRRQLPAQKVLIKRALGLPCGAWRASPCVGACSARVRGPS